MVPYSSVRGSLRWVLLPGFFLAGCVTPPEGIRTVSGGEQNDIPVPRTFELEKSYTPAVAAENNFRSWHGYYRGSGTLMEIAAWYVAEMPKQGWIYKGMESTHHRKQLHFVKHDERASIELYEELDPKEGKYLSIVHAEVHPVGPEEISFEENMLALTTLRQEGESEQAKAMPASASVGREAGAPVEAMEKGEKMGTAAFPAAESAAGGRAERAPAGPAAGSGKAGKDSIEEEIRRFEEGE
jgi:hypothetical protein